jgi:hypothetical protein
MKSRRQRAVGLLFWLGICAGLALLVNAEEAYLQQQFVDPPKPAAEAPPAVAGAAHPSSYALPPLASFSEVLKRPLFLENRRPVEPAPPIESVPEVGDFSIAGIVVSKTNRHVLVRAAEAGAVKRVHEGETINGWSVEKILADRVLLRRGEELEEMKPREKGQKNAKARSGVQRATGAPAGAQPITGLKAYAATGAASARPVSAAPQGAASAAAGAPKPAPRRGRTH